MKYNTNSGNHIEKIPMRDVEVRALVKEKFHLCKNCINRFSKEELILVFNYRFKGDDE